MAVGEQSGHLMPFIDVLKAEKRSEEGEEKDRVVLNQQLQLKHEPEERQKPVEDLDIRRMEVSAVKEDVG